MNATAVRQLENPFLGTKLSKTVCICLLALLCLALLCLLAACLLGLPKLNAVIHRCLRHLADAAFVQGAIGMSSWLVVLLA